VAVDGYLVARGGVQECDSGEGVVRTVTCAEGGGERSRGIDGDCNEDFGICRASSGEEGRCLVQQPMLVHRRRHTGS